MEELHEMGEDTAYGIVDVSTQEIICRLLEFHKYSTILCCHSVSKGWGRVETEDA